MSPDRLPDRCPFCDDPDTRVKTLYEPAGHGESGRYYAVQCPQCLCHGPRVDERVASNKLSEEGMLNLARVLWNQSCS